MFYIAVANRYLNDIVFYIDVQSGQYFHNDNTILSRHHSYVDDEAVVAKLAAVAVNIENCVSMLGVYPSQIPKELINLMMTG